MARFTVAFSRSAQAETDRIRAFDRKRVLGAIRANLLDQANVESRNRKLLGDGLTTDFEYVPPLWELRVGEYRVAYEVNELKGAVRICAVRYKPPHRTTAEVFDEKNDH